MADVKDELEVYRQEIRRSVAESRTLKEPQFEKQEPKKEKILSPLQLMRRMRRNKSEVETFNKMQSGKDAPVKRQGAYRKGLTMKMMARLQKLKTPRNLRSGILKLADTRIPQQRYKLRRPQAQSLSIKNTDNRRAVNFYEKQRLIKQLEINRRNNNLSESARAILSRLMKTQNQGLEARRQMARIQRERRIISESGNILKTPSLFSGKQDVDITPLEVPGNPLRAPSLFKENPNNNIMKKRKGTYSILDTKSAGNNLQF